MSGKGTPSIALSRETETSMRAGINCILYSRIGYCPIPHDQGHIVGSRHALGDEAHGHAFSHDPQTDESYWRSHVVILDVLCVPLLFILFAKAFLSVSHPFLLHLAIIHQIAKTHPLFSLGQFSPFSSQGNNG